MSLAHFSRQNLPNLWRHFLWPNFREFGRHPRLLTSSDTTFKQYCTTAHRKIWAKQTDRPENLDHNHAWLPIEIQAEVVPRRPASSGEVEFFSVSSAAVGNVPSWSEPDEAASGARLSSLLASISSCRWERDPIQKFKISSASPLVSRLHRGPALPVTVSRTGPITLHRSYSTVEPILHTCRLVLLILYNYIRMTH
jgi:hypothetical protein